MKRNPHFSLLKANYLFPEIALRKKQFLTKHPEAPLINLGIGDTTEPLADEIAQALSCAASNLGNSTTYSGYGPEQGIFSLREKISEVIYGGKIRPEEIFVSDGAKCDLGRLQQLFGKNVSIAVQDPAYPVYIDGSQIQGVENIHFLKCTPENSFFPNLDGAKGADLIYFCSPNNPTGAAATKEQLKKLIHFAHQNRSIIIYDAAYACYIQDPALPKSIYEIEGAEEVAIEVSSFSKLAGFTGVRLGWTVVPEKLKYEDGGSIRSDWNRLTTTLFNGASNIAQAGGLAVLTPSGLNAVKTLITYYMENARLLKEAFLERGHAVFGGTHAPYLWIYYKECSSWEIFQHFLEHYHIVTTPGVGFGPAGEGFIRLTAFGSRKAVLEAIQRLSEPAFV